jgi:hypothetical protein
MSEYLFEICFNPQFGPLHAQSFGDFCLRSFRDEVFEAVGKDDVAGTSAAVTKLLGKERVRSFWATHGTQVKSLLVGVKRTVYCYHFNASYEQRLPIVFAALDQLVEEPPASPASTAVTT